MKRWLALPLILLLSHCGGPGGAGGGTALMSFGGGFGGTSVSGSPAVINVSGWDPKEVQRPGSRYSERDLSALRRNGARALIARSAKGPLLDDKFASFLKSADREGLMLGAYHYVTMDQPAAAQAENFVNRVRAIARGAGISRRKILLVGDFDTQSTPQRIVDFIERVERRTGVTPVVYLENSVPLRDRLAAATPDQKRVMRRAPYWIALYNEQGTERTLGGYDQLTPDNLTALYDVWDNWVMWQYGGVIWENGRSAPKHYNTSNWRSPRYFGDMAMPMERNVFRGSEQGLRNFWNTHSFAWW